MPTSKFQIQYHNKSNYVKYDLTICLFHFWDFSALSHFHELTDKCNHYSTYKCAIKQLGKKYIKTKNHKLCSIVWSIKKICSPSLCSVVQNNWLNEIITSWCWIETISPKNSLYSTNCDISCVLFWFFDFNYFIRKIK